MENGNGNGKHGLAGQLAGSRDNGKVYADRHFDVSSLQDVLKEIRRAGGTGKLEINFANGHAKGEAKWSGFTRQS